MVKKKLNQYKGKLSPEQIAEGMNAANKNAVRLREDANLLLEQGRFPSAASLAILAIEESGKLHILRKLALSKDDKEIVGCWREYRSHTKKNVAWLFLQLFAQGARRLDDFSPLFIDGAEHPFLIDQVKQIGFYSDCLGQAHWTIPDDVIDEQLATMLVRIADTLTTPKHVTPKEIELWIEHLAPVWMVNLEDIRRALLSWNEDMQRHGLAPEGMEFEDFIYGPDEEDSPGLSV